MEAARGSRARDGAAAVRTFLIADVRGYTAFTARHGDEAASRLARTFAEIVDEASEAWGGRLVETRGDEALAVFTSSRQALQAAVELQDAFRDEATLDPLLPLRVGIGLDAGEAVPVGDGYRGAALNLAARLCASAGPGEIRASEGLIHLAGPIDGLEYQRLDPAPVKGLAGEVASIAVVGTAHAHEAAADATASPSPPLPAALEPIVPLAGRRGELCWLTWHWRRARHGHGRVAVLSGPPGIGKTRLSAELAGVAHGQGGHVDYFPSGRGIDERLDANWPIPTLLVVDDLDATARELIDDVTTVSSRVPGSPVLMLVTHREEAAASVASVVERIAPPERRLGLGPLEPEAIRAIATLYAGRAIDELPLHRIVEETAGVPAAIHRVAARWAREATARRLGNSMDRTEAGRRGLRDAEAELIGDVEDLETACELSRLVDAEDETPDEPGGAGMRAICPYKGLAAFEAADADYYFGRERLVAELVARLVGTGFLGIVGASGSGKSSALRAGLLPAMAGGVLPGSDRWRQVVTRPGEAPLQELRQALERVRPESAEPAADVRASLDRLLADLAPGQQLVVAVDQFEELFTVRDKNERDAFVDLLTQDRPGLKVVLTLRADHYGETAAYPSLSRLLAASQVLVGPLTAREVAAVIEHPARRTGLRVEPSLTEALVADAGTEPGILPLLSTTLLELWQARDGNRLTLASYRSSGGLRGAVARLAEAAFANLNPGQQAIARSVFLRLAGPGEGEGALRRRVALDELDVDRDPAVAQVVETLTAARLLTTGDGYVEVAHEALLREWPRLEGWLEEDATGRRLRLHLMGAVRDWEARGREPGDMYRGARLAAALDWAAEHRVELNAAERDFLEESRLASQREVDRERRTNRRLRGLLAGAAMLLIVAIGAGVLALNQGEAARQQAALAASREQDALAARREAENSARFARSRELAASALSVLSEDPSLSKLLAVAAASASDPDLEVASALHRTWAADSITRRITWPTAADADFTFATLHPDGRHVALGWGKDGPPRSLAVFDLESDQIVWDFTLDTLGTAVADAYVTPDGTRVVAGVFWEPGPEQEGVAPPRRELGVHVWDAKTGDLEDVFDAGPCGSLVIGISDRYALLDMVAEGANDATGGCYAADVPHQFDAMDLSSGERVPLVRDTFGDVALSGDGRYAAFTDLAGEPTSVVLDIPTRKRVLAFAQSSTAERQDNAYVRGLNRDGSLLLYGDRPVLVLDARSGEIVASLGEATGEAFGGAGFTPEGLAHTLTRDATLRTWDPATGDLEFAAPAAGVGRLTVADDGEILIANENTKTAVLVHPAVRGEVGTFVGCLGFTGAESLDVVGDTAVMATFCDDGPARAYGIDLSSVDGRFERPSFDGQTLALSPDAKRYAGQESIDRVIGALQVHDAETGELLVKLEGVCDWDQKAFTPRAETGACKPFPTQPFGLFNVTIAWSPDGSLVAALDHANEEGYFAVWDSRTGRLVHAQPRLGPSFWAILFAPDGATLIASTSDVPDGSPELVEFSTETWEILRRAPIEASLEGGPQLGFAGFMEDGTLIGVGGFGGTAGGFLHRIDVSSLTVVRSTRAHDGSPKSFAISPDGTRVVTGASDGIVRIWDWATGALLHQLSVPGQAQGVAFVDERHVAVAPQDGNLLIFTIDVDELAQIARSSLTRGLTEEECARFNFGAACPSLEELRTGN